MPFLSASQLLRQQTIEPTGQPQEQGAFQNGRAQHFVRPPRASRSPRAARAPRAGAAWHTRQGPASPLSSLQTLAAPPQPAQQTVAKPKAGAGVARARAAAQRGQTTLSFGGARVRQNGGSAARAQAAEGFPSVDVDEDGCILLDSPVVAETPAVEGSSPGIAKHCGSVQRGPSSGTAPQVRSLNSLLVGRQFHASGATALADAAQAVAGAPESDECKLTLFLEREPQNQYDPNALLVRCRAGDGEPVACGHLPREHARVLSPMIDNEWITAELEVAANDVATMSSGAALPVRVLVVVHVEGPQAEQLGSCLDGSRDLHVAGAARPSKSRAKAKTASAAQQQKQPNQRSLLINFGCGAVADPSAATSTHSAAWLSFAIVGAGVLPHVAVHMSIRGVMTVRGASREWRQAVDLLRHTKFRAAVERYVGGHGWMDLQFGPPGAIGVQCPASSFMLRELLAHVSQWSSAKVRLQDVLEGLAPLAFAEPAPSLAQRLELQADDGWPLIAAVLLTCPTAARMNVARAALAFSGVHMNSLRDLIALLVVLCSRRCEASSACGLRRLQADLLTCNRLFEDAGLKVPMRGLRMPGIRLTEEQVSIVARDLQATEILTVAAFAGSGKTSTLRMYASLRPHLKFLYICFNVSVREEAQRTFPENVTCKNAHQLAYAGCGYKFRHKLKDELRAEDVLSCNVFDKVAQGRKGDGRKYEVAEATLATLQAFHNSAAAQVSKEHLPRSVQGLVLDGVVAEADIIEAARALWYRMCQTDDQEVRMTHGGYLKQYSLSKPELSYDVILLDEAQDCNPAIADIVTSQRCARILVGDKHQAIYGFLGAQDVLKAAGGEIKGSPDVAFQRQLTRCFRFGPNIADVANFVLHEFKNEMRPLLGCGIHEGMLLPSARGDALEDMPPPPFAFVARTNAAVIILALRAEQVGLDLSWVGGVKGYRLDLLRDLCYLALGQRELAENARVRAFASLDAFRNFAKRIDDREVLARIDLVRKCEPRELLQRLERLQNAAEQREATGKRAAIPAPPAVWLATVHKAKGLEWDTVVLADDFTSPEDFLRLAQTDDGQMQGSQEVNALYVALTRAKRRLQLPRPHADFYLRHMEAASLVCALAANHCGQCPSCGTPVTVDDGTRRDTAKLIVVGSVTLRPLCSACRDGAYVCSFTEPVLHSLIPYRLRG